ncbi:hypothetical protein ACJ41O_009641 [Fusarium nematophilum]
MFQQKKPYSAVTVTIENLTSEAYEEEDLSGIPELVEVIKLQASGPGEAARAIRKKLKYGNVHRQIRALVLLDGLIQNAGERFQRTFVDEPLLERLRELPKRKQAVTQERSKVLRETEENPFVDDEEEAAAKAAREARNAPGPSEPPQSAAQSFSHSHAKSSSGGSGSFFGGSKDKKKEKEKAKGKRKPFNLEAEKEQMKTVIADSSIAATNLMNALQSINRERERISDNQHALERFEACKLLRRKVLRYIHHVEHEQWLGGLLHANDELVHALMSFEQLDRSIDADSDSDDELAEQAHLYRMATLKGKEAMAKAANAQQSPTGSQPPDLSELTISPSPTHVAPPRPPPMSKAAPPPQPPRPVAAPVARNDDDDDDDDDDPFGDKHVIETPFDREQPRW